jgi:hypothetical protein
LPLAVGLVVGAAGDAMVETSPRKHADLVRLNTGDRRVGTMKAADEMQQSLATDEI